MNARTTNADRLEYLRLFRDEMLAFRARGEDLEDMIRVYDRAIRRREKEASQCS